MFVNGEQFALGDHASNTSSEPPTSGRILAITGCTNSGKTTIAKMLTNMVENHIVSLSKVCGDSKGFQFLDEGATVQIIHQDDFYYTQEKVSNTIAKVDRSVSLLRNVFYLGGKGASEEWKQTELFLQLRLQIGCR